MATIKNALLTLVILLLILILPIGVNFIVGSKTPTDTSIVGDPKDWISFYGNYAGGIITSLISFVILFYTIKASRREAEITRKKQDIENLSNKLEEIISLASFARIGNVSLFLDNKLMCENEILNLDKLSDELIRKKNIMHLLYDIEYSYHSHIREFMLKLDLCSSVLSEEIRVMIILIKEYINISSVSGLDWQKEDQIKRIKERISRQISNKAEYLTPLYEASRNWLDTEKSALKKLTK